MKKCNSCGETKPLIEMCKDSSRADGYRPLCRACRSAEQSGYRARPKTKVVEVKAQSREASPFKPYIVNDGHYFYRNDGLKHIKSRGV